MLNRYAICSGARCVDRERSGPGAGRRVDEVESADRQHDGAVSPPYPSGQSGRHFGAVGVFDPLTVLRWRLRSAEGLEMGRGV